MKIIDNKLVDKTISLLGLFLEKNKPNERNDFGRKSNTPLTKYERYLLETVSACDEVNTSLNQLKMAIFFFTDFQSSKKFKDNFITEFDNLTYHIENYIFRLTGLLDRILILVKIILQLQINDKNCTPGFLLKSKKGKKAKYADQIINKNEELYKLLVKINDIIYGFRNQRNKISHNSKFSNNQMQEVEGASILLQDEEDIEDSIKLMGNIKIKREIKNYEQDFNKLNSKLEQLWKLICIELEKEFIKIYDSLIK